MFKALLYTKAASWDRIFMRLVASLLLVAMPGAPSSFLFLVRPGAPSLLLVAMPGLHDSVLILESICCNVGTASESQFIRQMKS